MLLPDPRSFYRAAFIALPLCFELTMLLHGEAHAKTRHRQAAGMVIASYYGHGERLNTHTASGERFRPEGLTAAHRSLPLGTKLLVRCGKRSVVVRVNDRGPAAWTGRSIDLSRGAAKKLHFIKQGTARVQITVLKRG